LVLSGQRRSFDLFGLFGLFDLFDQLDQYVSGR